MTAPPLFDGHGHTIPDPADSTLDDAAIATHVDAIRDIPFEERHAFLDALQYHWDAIHLATEGDHHRLWMDAKGYFYVRTVYG